MPTRTYIQPKEAVLLFGRVVQGVRLTNVPQYFLDTDCVECSKLFLIKVTKSDIVPGVKVEYIPKSQFQFLIEFDFHGIIAIPAFTFTIQINPKYAKYFTNEDLDQIEILHINPALLAKYDTEEVLVLGDINGNKDKIDLPEKAKQKALGLV